MDKQQALRRVIREEIRKMNEEVPDDVVERLRRIVKEEARRMDEAAGDPDVSTAIRKLDLRDRFGYERRGNTWTSKNTMYDIEQQDYSVEVRGPNGYARFYSQAMLHKFLRAVL